MWKKINNDALIIKRLIREGMKQIQCVVEGLITLWIQYLINLELNQMANKWKYHLKLLIISLMKHLDNLKKLERFFSLVKRIKSKRLLFAKIFFKE